LPSHHARFVENTLAEGKNTLFIKTNVAIVRTMTMIAHIKPAAPKGLLLRDLLLLSCL
jgi:hypothetical protein